LRDEIRAFPEPVNGMVAAADTEKQESAVQIWGMLRVKKPATDTQESVRRKLSTFAK
jgi:hypothetical protein